MFLRRQVYAGVHCYSICVSRVLWRCIIVRWTADISGFPYSSLFLWQRVRDIRIECWHVSFPYMTWFFCLRQWPAILLTQYCACGKTIRMRWAGHVARMGERRGVHWVLVGKPEGKRPLGRPRRRWEDNIKMDLHEVGGGCGEWMELAQDKDRWLALVSTVMKLRVP